MKKGDVLLVYFPFTDLSGNKLRPALVLAKENDIILAFLTSNFKKRYDSDVLINKNIKNGLKKDSILRLNKIVTLDESLLAGKIGELTTIEIKEIDTKLIKLFDIQKLC